jgi:geranyl-CoA carboxylase alpha subunit
VALRGHAIEARLYAEDPAHGFAPSTGRVAHLELPRGEGVRVDHGLAPGVAVSSHYDPMLAKVIAYGADREQARRRLLRALADTHVFGVRTNQRFLQTLLEHDAFVSARATTDFVERELAASQQTAQLSRADWLGAAALFALRGAGRDELANFSNCVGLAWPLRLACDGTRVDLSIAPTRERSRFLVQLGAERVALHARAAGQHEVAWVMDGVQHRVAYAWDGEQLWLETSLGARAFCDETHAPRDAALEHGSGRALAPMDGAVVDVPVRTGERVSRGQTVAVVEAMKLELRVPADIDGVVHAIHVARGQQVKARQMLVELAAG